MFIRQCPKCSVLASRWPGDPNLEGGKRCAHECPDWDFWPFHEERPVRVIVSEIVSEPETP